MRPARPPGGPACGKCGSKEPYFRIPKAEIDPALKALYAQEREVASKIAAFKRACKHRLVPQGFSDCPSAACAKCGERFGWWCPKSKDHLCHYEKYGSDRCEFCGDPSERK